MSDEFHAIMRPEEFYQSLDSGIRFVVRVLHANGIDTQQSCQGGEGHCYLQPTVDVPGLPWDAVGFRVLSCLAGYGLPVDALNYHWPVMHGIPYEAFWRITFFKQMPERADEKPTFVWGYRGQ